MKAKTRGNCYVTCEALYHLLGGKKAGYVPHRLKHEGDTHWYLVKRFPFPPVEGTSLTKMKIWQIVGSVIIDPTASQFKTPPDYSKGVGAGFLTKKPSKRAREMMKKLVWQ